MCNATYSFIYYALQKLSHKSNCQKHIIKAYKPHYNTNDFIILFANDFKISSLKSVNQCQRTKRNGGPPMQLCNITSSSSRAKIHYFGSRGKK